MTDSKFKRQIIFVGGAPRSGTTVTHALLCTSEHTNAYHPEISYVRPLFLSFEVGTHNWGSHTKAFFGTPEQFAHHSRVTVMHALNHIARRLGEPEVLSVKDPLLTPHFYWVRKLLPEQAKFVTVVRNPYHVVRSRQEVIEKSGKPFAAADAAATAREYVKSYAHLDLPELAGAQFHLRYEDLTEPDIVEGLRRFTGFDDIATEKVWPEKRQMSAAAAQDPWFSPKYHAPINTESRFDPLAPEFCAVVDRICAPLMKRFKYPRLG